MRVSKRKKQINEKVEATKIYPILLQSETAANGDITNRIRVADLGFTFAGTNYVSYKPTAVLAR